MPCAVSRCLYRLTLSTKALILYADHLRSCSHVNFHVVLLSRFDRHPTRLGVMPHLCTECFYNPTEPVAWTLCVAGSEMQAFLSYGR